QGLRGDVRARPAAAGRAGGQRRPGRRRGGGGRGGRRRRRGRGRGAVMADPQDQAVEVEETETEEQQAAERVEEDLDELRSRAAERDEYLALAQRTQADFENYRKRMAKETATAQDRGVKRVVSELLPALDNFERALAAAEAEEADEEHHLTKGIRLVQQELAAALTRVGIETFSPKGEV